MNSTITDERLKEILAGPTPDNEGWLIRKSGYFYRPDRAGYTKLNQYRLCCKFQGIAERALSGNRSGKC